MTEFDLLYKLQNISKENDIRIEIDRDCIFFKRSGEVNNKPYKFNYVFSVSEIENVYKSLENCADVYMGKLEEEIESLRYKLSCIDCTGAKWEKENIQK